MESSAKKISKRSRKGRDKHRSRGLDLGYVKAAPNKELEEQLGAAQREAALSRAAAQHSEQQRKWAVEASSADFISRIHTERELKETEDIALYALEAYERADKQRTDRALLPGQKLQCTRCQDFKVAQWLWRRGVH